MKLSALILAATLGAVSAAPISLIYITNTGRTIVRTNSSPSTSNADTNADHPFANIRLGHAAAFASTSPTGPTPAITTHSGCHGFRAKMDRVREMLGLAPIMKDDESAAFHILPNPHRHHEEGTVGKVTWTRFKTGDAPLRDRLAIIMPFPVPEVRMREPTFWDRSHRALNELGPWEGRAVTFVLGCGMGVILRMFFVLGILFVRARRMGSRQAIELPIEHQVIFVAPPQYIIEQGAMPLIDEKVPVYEEIETPMIVDLDEKKDVDASA